MCIKLKNLAVKIWAWPLVRKLAALALIMRLAQSWAAALWYDEGVSVVFARLPWRDMIAATAADVHPPAYYVLLWAIDKTGLPLTDFTARIPSIIFSVLAVYLAWELAARFKLSRQGIIAVTVWVVISPLQLHYSQEARMYGLLQVEVLAALLFILDRRRAALAAVLTLMLYTHNYAVFYLPCLVLAALAWYQINIFFWPGGIKELIEYFTRRWLPWYVIPVLAWLPWLARLLDQMGTVSAGYWIQPVTPAAVIFVLYQMLFAYSMPPTFQGLGVLLTCGVLMYSGWRLYRDRPRYFQILLIMAFMPLLLAVLVSLAWKPVLLFRGLIGSVVPLAILVIKALEGITIPYKRYYAYGLIAVTLVAGLAGHYLYNADNKGETITWVHDIKNKLETGDVILALNDNGMIAVKTYAPELPVYKLPGCGQEPLGSLSPGTRQAIGTQERGLDQLLKGASTDNPNNYPLQFYNRVWFISTVAPVSPPCEIEAASNIIQADNVYLIKELADNEYTQAGVYLIVSPGEVY